MLLVVEVLNSITSLPAFEQKLIPIHRILEIVEHKDKACKSVSSMIKCKGEVRYFVRETLSEIHSQIKR